MQNPCITPRAVTCALIIVAAFATLSPRWVGGDEPMALLDNSHPMGIEPAGAIGPDITLCQLFNLRQFGREGGIVGLASGVTAWNIGDEEVDWYVTPDPRHPFFVSNMYRLKNNRFEQIGQSWVMHGFCALGGWQCSAPCVFPTGCTSLNVGCTKSKVPKSIGQLSCKRKRDSACTTSKRRPMPASE